MRRHQQNISFVAIIGVLLSCAFFFSQQINNNTPIEDKVDASLPKAETLEDLPDCSVGLTETTEAACYAEAATLSNQLVKNKVDTLLALEGDTGKRMAFMETQSSWEASRNADCAFIGELSEDTDRQEIAKNTCLRDHNLERLSLLETMICNYYDSVECEAFDTP